MWGPLRLEIARNGQLQVFLESRGSGNCFFLVGVSATFCDTWLLRGFEV